LVILLKSTDFGLAVRNSSPDTGKLPLHEMWERNDGFFFGRTRAAMPSISFVRN
jgi:hypothetical protein